jgi:transposase
MTIEFTDFLQFQKGNSPQNVEYIKWKQKTQQKRSEHLMYIRQECLLSFDEIIKYQPKTKLELILAQLDFSNILTELTKIHATRGPKGHGQLAILYSLIAMQVEQIKTIKKLADRLKNDPVFRYTCGFNVLQDTPSASTFSRFLNKIANCSGLEEDFRQLVIKAKQLGIIDGTDVAIDSTCIHCYEKAKPKSKLIDDGNSSDWAVKKGSDGKVTHWFGYKLHIVCDCKSGLPLSILMTSASTSDSAMAIQLIKKFKSMYNVFRTKQYIMDSAYDAQENYDFITYQCNANAIIAYNKRGQVIPPLGFNEEFQPICSNGYPLTYWGKDGNYLKFRCANETGKVSCPFGSIWCSNSNYGYCFKVNYKKNNRYFGYPYRGSEKWQLEYNKRSSIERCNSMLKEHLNIDNVRFAGIPKAKVCALLSCISLLAGTIAVNQKSDDLKTVA